MGLNLLPQVTEADIKKADTKTRSSIIVVIWFGLLLTAFVIIYLYKSVEEGKLKQAETEKQQVIARIEALGSFHDQYYTLAYKSSVLSQIKTDQYYPSVISKYVEGKIANRAKIDNYYFDNEGNFRLIVTTKSFFMATKVWHELLQDKKIITSLNLNSFSPDKEGNVNFQLKGTLNLEELYARDRNLE